MSIKAINAAFELPAVLTFRDDGSDGGVSIAAKFLLVTLADYADDVGRCWPKQETLARRTSMGERSIRETLALLERRGLIRRVERRRDDGSRRTDIIHLAFLLPALTAGSVDDAPEPQDVDEPTGTHRRLINRRLPPDQPAVAAGQEPPLEPPSLSLGMIREISGDALADPAKSLGVASYHRLTGIMDGENACTLEDVKAGLTQAAAWYRGKRGPGSMSNYDLAAKLAGEARDARLAGAPPVTEGRTHEQPAYSPAAKRIARDEQNARSFAVGQSVIAERARRRGG